MGYYWFTRQELLQKAKNCGGKGKAAEYYCKNKNVIKEKANNKYRNLSQEKKETKRKYQQDRYRKMKEKFIF